MKQLIVCLFVAMMLFTVSAIGQERRGQQPPAPTHDKALLFTLNGLSNLSLGSYAGGVGLKLQDGTSRFWTLAFDFTTVENKTDVAFGAGHFWQLAPLKTTFAYIGPSAYYKTTNKEWDIDGTFGVEWAAWQDVSITGAYCVAVTLPHDGTTVAGIVPSGKLGLVCYF